MKLKKLFLAGVVLAGAVYGLAGVGSSRQAEAQSRRVRLPADDPDLKKKIVPIITGGSNISIGVAQVQGGASDVNRVKAVVQYENDYKNVARFRILVPIQTEKVLKHIDRVPGVSVSAIADYKIKK